MLTEEQALERVRSLITYDRNQTALAAELGVTPATVSAVMRGHRVPSNEMLAMAGLRRRTVFEEINEGGSG